MALGAHLVDGLGRDVRALELLALDIDELLEGRVEVAHDGHPVLARRCAISSRRSSMRAVNPTSTNSPKWSTSRSVTMRATSSGWSRFSFTTT